MAEPLTTRLKVASNKKMNLAERLYLPQIFGGLTTTIKHFFKKKITISYPEQKTLF